MKSSTKVLGVLAALGFVGLALTNSPQAGECIGSMLILGVIGLLVAGILAPPDGTPTGGY